MRTALSAFALLLFPLCASAASLADCEGKWGVDLVSTAKHNPHMPFDDSMLSLTLTLDAAAKSIRVDEGTKILARYAFTVEKESPDALAVTRADGRRLLLRPYAKNKLSIGELREGKAERVMYFVRQR